MARSISSTSSSSTVAQGTTGGLYGRTVAPTIPGVAMGGTICSSAIVGVASLASGASTAAAASAPKVSTVSVVASVAVADAPVVCANGLPSPGPPAAAADLSSGCRALGDSGMGVVDVVSTAGVVLGVALHNVNLSVFKRGQGTTLQLQDKYTHSLVFRFNFLNRRYLPDPPGATVWFALVLC